MNIKELFTKKVWPSVLWYLKGLTLENGEPSLTRFIVIISFGLFIGVTIYLVGTGTKWDAYVQFASLTGGGGILTTLANKVNNSINNSRPNEALPSKYRDSGGNEEL